MTVIGHLLQKNTRQFQCISTWLSHIRKTWKLSLGRTTLLYWFVTNCWETWWLGKNIGPVLLVIVDVIQLKVTIFEFFDAIFYSIADLSKCALNRGQKELCMKALINFTCFVIAGWPHHLSSRNTAFSKNINIFLQLSSMKFYINPQLEIQNVS